MRDIWIDNLWERNERNIKLLGTSHDTRLALDWDDTIAITTSNYNDNELAKGQIPDFVSTEFERTIVLAPGINQTIDIAKQTGAKVGIFTRNSRTLMRRIFRGEIACFGGDLKLSFSSAKRLLTYSSCGREIVVDQNDDIGRYLYDMLISKLDFAIGHESFIDNAPFNSVRDVAGNRHYTRELKLLGMYGKKSIVYDDMFDGQHNKLQLPDDYQKWARGLYISCTPLSEEIKTSSQVNSDTVQKICREQEALLGVLTNLSG